MRDRLVSSVAAVLGKIGLSPDSNLVIGVSGGPDSLALMHILHELRPAKSLIIGHLDHGLRPDSRIERMFVSEMAASWNLVFRHRQIDVKKLAAQEGWTLEEAGRHARYQFLASLAGEANTDYVIVGHNADDQAETVLMHILRGSGLSGLKGMELVSPMPGFERIKIVRPLLHISRKKIEAYCETNDLKPQFDETNVDTAFFRNRLRYELLPILETYNPNIKTSLGHLAAILAPEDDFLRAETENAWKKILRQKEPGWLQIDRIAWQSLPLGLRRRTLIQAIKELRPFEDEISFLAIDQAEKVASLGDTGAQSALPGGLWLRIEYDAIYMTADPDLEQDSDPQMPGSEIVPLPIPGMISLSSGWILSAEYAEVDSAEVMGNRDRWQVYLDMKATEELFVRGRLPGEKMQPLGMKGSSALVQDVMVNKKLRAELRSRWPIVVNREHVVWIVGLHVDERARVNPESAGIVHLFCRRVPEKEMID